MTDVQPLIGLLEVLLHLSKPRPRLKAGGYSEDIFVDLTEEEKEEFECSICYQILKEPQGCQNNHKYCYACIYTWSNSSYQQNHGRCPVCRVEGVYRKCHELDEKIGNKTVKCTLKTCSWKGPLKNFGSHRHTTYTRTGLPYRPTNRERIEDDLPALTDRRITGSETPRSTRNTRPNSVARRQNTNTSRGTSNLVESSPFTPRPPSTRPQGHGQSQGQGQRRVPTLPSIVNQSGRRNTQVQGRTQNTTRNVGTNIQNSARQGQHVSIRDRLRESRDRLDAMMTAFASELERGRRDIADFQQERERRRQEQLQEVRDLGRRLGHVATELRGLLERRRQMSNDTDSSSDDDDF